MVIRPISWPKAQTGKYIGLFQEFIYTIKSNDPNQSVTLPAVISVCHKTYLKFVDT